MGEGRDVFIPSSRVFCMKVDVTNSTGIQTIYIYMYVSMCVCVLLYVCQCARMCVYFMLVILFVCLHGISVCVCMHECVCACERESGCVCVYVCLAVFSLWRLMCDKIRETAHLRKKVSHSLSLVLCHFLFLSLSFFHSLALYLSFSLRVFLSFSHSLYISIYLCE